MLTYNFVYDFATPHAQTIINIMIREWGYNYIDGFGYTSTSEYKLWKNDTVFLVAENESKEFVGMVAFERYNIARNARFTPCICCLYVSFMVVYVFLSFLNMFNVFYMFLLFV